MLADDTWTVSEIWFPVAVFTSLMGCENANRHVSRAAIAINTIPSRRTSDTVDHILKHIGLTCRAKANYSTSHPLIRDDSLNKHSYALHLHIVNNILHIFVYRGIIELMMKETNIKTILWPTVRLLFSLSVGIWFIYDARINTPVDNTVLILGLLIVAASLSSILYTTKHFFIKSRWMICNPSFPCWLDDS